MWFLLAALLCMVKIQLDKVYLKMQLKWPYFINLIPSGHHEVQYTSLSLTTRKTVYREWLTSYLPLSKYFFKNTTGALLFVVYNAFFLAHITADQLPFWMQGFVFLSFHYHPNDMIVRRNPLLQKLADDTKKKKKSLTPPRRHFSHLTCCQYLPV